MPATIFAGSKVKALKSTLSLNGGADVISSTTDPTSVAVDAAAGSLLLNTTSGKLYRKNDSGSSTNWSEVGSGGSGINYVTNPTAATNTTGWSTYADAAGAQPVDGTGGSPTVTWTRSTTTPLRGAGDFNFTKDAVNRQGEGVATDITIDLADQAKVLTVSFDYEVLSGTYATGDLTVYLIADPSGTPVVIQPAGYQVQSGTAGTKLKQIATFQTQATGQSYRVCFHVASTSASAYSLAIDNVVVGPQTVQYGAPVTDWVDYTPTGAWNTNVTYSGKWRRVGDSMEIRARVLCSGAPNAFGLSINLPSGYSMDTTKLASASAGGTPLGYGQAVDVGFGSYPVSVLYYGSTTTLGIYDGVASGTYLVNTNVSNAAPFTFGAADFVEIVSVVPILGWSSTVQMSNDTDTRVVAAGAYYNAAAIVCPSGSDTLINNYAATTLDTHGQFTISTGSYVVPVSGVYRIETLTLLNSGAGVVSAAFITRLFINNVYTTDIARCDTTPAVYNASSIVYSGSTLVSLNAGQTLTLKIFQNSGQNKTLAGSNVYISRLSGPSAIAATETVAGRWVNEAGTSIGTSSAYPTAVVPFASSDVNTFDTHGMASGSGTTWKVTAPVSGKYLLTANIISDSTTGAATINLYKNGTTVIGSFRQYATAASTVFCSGSNTVSLNAGDFVQVLVYVSTSGSLLVGDGYNVFTMTRVGN